MPSVDWSPRASSPWRSLRHSPLSWRSACSCEAGPVVPNPAGSRGAPPRGAEARGHRAAGRRDRARLQQHPHRDQQLRRVRVGEPRRANAPEQSDLAGIREAADRAAALTAQLLAFGQEADRPTRHPGSARGARRGRLLATASSASTSGSKWRPPPVEPGRLTGPVDPGRPQSRDQRPRRDARRWHADDRSPDVRLSDEYARVHLGVDPGAIELAVSDTGHGMPPE